MTEGRKATWVIKFGRVQSYINFFAPFFNKCLELETRSSGGVERAGGAVHCCGSMLLELFL